MRRSLAGFGITLSLMVLAACGSPESSQESTTIPASQLLPIGKPFQVILPNGDSCEYMNLYTKLYGEYGMRATTVIVNEKSVVFTYQDPINHQDVFVEEDFLGYTSNGMPFIPSDAHPVESTTRLKQLESLIEECGNEAALQYTSQDALEP